jgi:uncharacterized phosphatase
MNLFSNSMIKRTHIFLVVVLLSFQQFAIAKKSSPLGGLRTKQQEFYFVRHGQTDHNLGFAPDLDLPLNLCGRKQIESLQPLLSSLDIKTICYSPLLRTVQTADLINFHLHAKRRLIPNLKECEMQTCVGLKDVQTKSFLELLPSLQEFIRHVKKGVEVALSSTGPVLIVAHGGVYGALCVILGIEIEGIVGNAQVVHFYKDHHKVWHAQQLNQSFHEAPCQLTYFES